MIITRLKGGMGNQMFQYAMALNVATLLETDMQMDLCALLDRSKGDFVYRDYDLSIFKVKENFATHPAILRRLSKFKSSSITRFFRERVNKGRTYVKEQHFHFQPEIIQNATDNTIFEGWFQSPRYFETIAPTIRKHFAFKEPIATTSQSLLNSIQSTNAVCLNVRRTDFLKVDNLNTTNLDYFLGAMQYITAHLESPHFFVFSDDVDWCREHLKTKAPLTIVGHEHKGHKFGNYMQLMIACQHYIIPNSSFAWWAVWLNDQKNKTVIAPKNWFNDPSINTSDLVPEEWIRL